MAYAIDNPAPSTFILITGDRDFAYVVSILRLRRYQIILVTLPTAHASLTSQASICVDWLSEVLEPVQRPPNVSGNRTELPSLGAPPPRDRPGENSYPPSRTSSSPQYMRQSMDFGGRSEEIGDLPQFLRNANQRRQSPHSSNSGRAFVPERNQLMDLSATTEQLEMPSSRPITLPFGPSGRNVHHSASPLVTQTVISPQTQRQNLLPPFVNKLSNVALTPDKLHDPGLPIDGNAEDTSTLNQTISDISPPAEEFALLLPSQRPASAPGSLPSSPPTTNQGSPIPCTPIMTPTPVQDLPSVGRALPGANKSLVPIEVVAPLISNPPILAVEKTEAVKQMSSPRVTVAVPSATPATVVPSKQTSTIPAQQVAIGGPTVPPPTSTPVVPPTFRILVECLQSTKSKGHLRPLRSVVSVQISKNGTTYKAAGVTKFSQYVALAEKQGIVEIGGSEGTAWIALKKDWYHASLS